MTIMPTSTTIDPDSDYGRFLADTPQPSRPVSLVRRSSCVSSIQTLDDPCTTESLPQLRRDSDKTDSGAGSGSGESTDSPVKRSTVWRRFKKVFRWVACRAPLTAGSRETTTSWTSV